MCSCNGSIGGTGCYSSDGLEKFAGPRHWNDPDMLEIGNGGMSPDHYRTQMSLWAILAAPLLAGNDLSKMDETTRSILINKEVIAVDQEKLGIQGSRIGPPQIWMKPLSDGSKAVALFNFVVDDEAEPLTLKFKDVFTSATYGLIRMLVFFTTLTPLPCPKAEL